MSFALDSVKYLRVYIFLQYVSAPHELQQTMSLSMEGAPLHLSTLNSDGRSTRSSRDASNSSINSSMLSSGSDPMSISELVVRVFH